MQLGRDVTIWQSEFAAHRVPPLCVKSGVPAAGTWTFVFGAPSQYFMSTRFGGMRVRIPLARSWLNEFTAMFAVQTAGAAVAVPCFLLSLVLPSPPRELRDIAILAAVISGATAVLLALERPRGSVHRLASGQSWLLLVGVHPAFVEAVHRSRPEADRLFSQDGKWYWDGARWTTNEFPEQWWRTFFGGLEKVRPWQITLGAVFLWVALGAFAWWSFHR